MLENGKKIPAFKLADQSEKAKNFKDLAGKNGLVLYSYPKDSTSGCTAEAQEFRDLKADFEKKGYNVVGISKDSVKSHGNFTEKNDLNFPLLSDPETSLLGPIGAFGEKTRCGKTSMGIFRNTYIFDNKGKLLKSYQNVKAKGHAQKVLEDLES